MVSSGSMLNGLANYDAGNHQQVLFQCVGSVWPKALPFCIANVFFMIVLSQLLRVKELGLGITGQAHALSAMLVSMLLILRIHTAMTRRSESREYLGIMYRESRTMIQNILVFSRKHKNTSMESKKWRTEAAYRMLMVLRTSVAIIQYPSLGINAWEVPELTGQELEYCTPSPSWRRHGLLPHTNYTDSMRVPLLMAYLLRESIVSQDERLPNPMPFSQEDMLIRSIDSFLEGYYGMQKSLMKTTPFILMQLSRTIVVLYVFTLPFALLNNPNSLVEHCAVVFALTYGFMGAELVSIELEAPFGTTTNGFDVLAFAQTVFEDKFLMIHDTDGEAWADALRYKMHQRVQDPISPSELTGLLPTTDFGA